MCSVNKTLTCFCFTDDSETQDPTATRDDDSSQVIKELGELKELMKDIQKRQGAMEKAIKNLASELGVKQFDLAKSSHAVSLCFFNLIITNTTCYIFFLYVLVYFGFTVCLNLL